MPVPITFTVNVGVTVAESGERLFSPESAGDYGGEAYASGLKSMPIITR